MLSKFSAALAIPILAVAPTACVAETFTGVEMLEDERFRFPTVDPLITGTSIDFLWGAQSRGFGKLFSVDLKQPTSLAEAFVVNASIGITRLGPGSGWDPHFVVSNGSDMTGIRIDGNSSAGTGVLRTNYRDDGLNGAYLGDTFATSIATQVPFEAAAVLELQFHFDASGTAISYRLLGETALTTGALIDPLDGLTFSMLSDDDAGENYRVDFISITPLEPLVVVPEPTALGSCLIVLSGYFGATRRLVAGDRDAIGGS